MRILITADIHNGYPGRIDDTVWAMRRMHEYAVENGIPKIIVLGDLFHNREYINIDVLNKVFDFFEESSREIEWIVFPGNHDMFMKTSWKINSIRPLNSYIRTINNVSTFTLDDRRFIVVPFIHYEHQYMNTMKYLEDKYDEDDVILTHIGINNAVNNSCFLIKLWSQVNFTNSKFNLVFSGHFHNHQIIDNKVCYPGSPIPFKFEEGMVPHGFIDFDTNDLLVNFIDLKDISDTYPSDFITIEDDYYKNLSEEEKRQICKNNKVRVVLCKEYSKNELDSIRNDMADHGSESVSWMKLKNDDSEGGEIGTVMMGSDVFESWLSHTDTSKYDVDMLRDIQESVAKEAEDLYIRSAEDDDE